MLQSRYRECFYGEHDSARYKGLPYHCEAESDSEEAGVAYHSAVKEIDANRTKQNADQARFPQRMSGSGFIFIVVAEAVDSFLDIQQIRSTCQMTDSASSESREFLIDPADYKVIDKFCQENHITCDILARKSIAASDASYGEINASNASRNDQNNEKSGEGAERDMEKMPKTEGESEAVVGSESAEHAEENAPPSYLSFKFKCSTCETGFDDAKEHREHFRSDWHRFNMKRKNRNLPIMTEEEFNSLNDEDRELFLRQDSIAT